MFSTEFGQCMAFRNSGSTTDVIWMNSKCEVSLAIHPRSFMYLGCVSIYIFVFTTSSVPAITATSLCAVALLSPLRTNFLGFFSKSQKRTESSLIFFKMIFVIALVRE